MKTPAYLKKCLFVLVLIAITAGCQAQAQTTAAPTAQDYPVLETVTDNVASHYVGGGSGPVVIKDFTVTKLPDNKLGINVCTSGEAGVGLTIRVKYWYWAAPVAPTPPETIKELGTACFTPVDRPVIDLSSIKSIDNKIFIEAEVKTSQDPNWQNPTVKVGQYAIPGQ